MPNGLKWKQLLPITTYFSGINYDNYVADETLLNWKLSWTLDQYWIYQSAGKTKLDSNDKGLSTC